MGIRDLLLEIARTYDASEGTRLEVSGQRVLREVESRTDLPLPTPLFARGYGGQTSAAATPWIGVFDPEVNSSAREGLYLAYIFSADLRTVSLTLQQGITHLEYRLGKGQARQDHLRRQAARLRRAVAMQRRNEWVDEPELRHGAARPKAYEAASVIARQYDVTDLPQETALGDDLVYAADALKRTSVAERLWWFEDEESQLEVSYATNGHVANEGDPLAGFQPKDSSDYIANIAAKQQIKRRRHESLIAEFGLHIASRGFTPKTKLMHPRDLVLHRQNGAQDTSDEWLVEAKVVRDGNPTEAVRHAVGQLFEYSHFLYRERGRPEPHLVGLFTEDVGVYSGYLEQRGIASIWQTSSGWDGSASANGWGMTG
ncbi:MrcB family domain-containing protein [Streptomyces sp. NPDC051217]|uniref:MrcB family domain-containing protein n=1 Tax=Streptomyces sp. NPDC051217 TaxID=3365644 RepID=UPI003796B1A1